MSGDIVIDLPYGIKMWYFYFMIVQAEGDGSSTDEKKEDQPADEKLTNGNHADGDSAAAAPEKAKNGEPTEEAATEKGEP